MNSLLFKRPAAYFTDFVIVWCVCVLPQLITFGMFDGMPFNSFNKPHHIYFWVLLTVSLPVWLYFIFFESAAWQSTPGKKIFRLKVTDLNNSRIKPAQSVLRTFVKLLPWEMTHIGLLPVYFSPSPQATIGLYLANGLILLYVLFFIFKKGEHTLHDSIARTKVIAAQSR